MKILYQTSQKSIRILITAAVILLFSNCSKDTVITDQYKVINKYQEGEENLSDDLSVLTTNNNSFGKEIPGLSRIDKIRFASGNSLFNQSWVSAPASTTSLDGLGPTFNARACASCHFKDGRGKPFEPSNIGSVGFLIRLSIAGKNAHGGPMPVPNYGLQLQNHANLNIPKEADIQVNFTLIKGTYPDGTPYELQKPTYSFINENFGSLSGVLISPRVGQQTIGLGFIDALSESEILKNADEFDTDKDGISGKPNYVWDAIHNNTALGKFGWKANEPTLKQQIAGAFSGDLGLSTSIFTQKNCPSPQQDCNKAPNGGSPEVTDKQLDRIVLYQTSLAVPKRRDFKNQTVLNGKVLFTKLKCIVCHATNLKTSKYPFNSLVENKEISPYSDFLLHDMGADLADDRPDFLASGKEWRTQPLWGIGLIQTVNKHSFLLHDGRARSIEEAILWHGGEAEKPKNDFKNLSSKKRKELLAFIESL
ncbi:di-heme oxidoredictase family protein [Tenacibaculum piscium]|uniref:di-heme oxidoreductase family protein n=2 Tax=Tenacibaculum piscium TaxID=1458515 RepID=UPI001F30455E|nr:di-heme oxidoredictase family protein [Tenacibaculum piscium]